MNQTKGGGIDNILNTTGDVLRPPDDVAALFSNEPRQSSKKRKRQRLTDAEKIEAAFAAIEGVRAIAKLLVAATKPAASSADPSVQQVVECMIYSSEKLDSCASTLHLACSNTAAKKCASLAHRKLEKEERLCQEGEQLLVRGIGEVSPHDALGHALEDTKAAFVRLSKKKLSLEPQQFLADSRRAAPVDPPPAEVSLPPPPEGHRLYSMSQAMSVVASHPSSRRTVITEMINRQLVPVKRSMMFRYASKYVGEGKPEAPMHWPCGSGGIEIMSLGELKRQFFAHQDQRTGDMWMRKDTATLCSRRSWLMRQVWVLIPLALRLLT